MKKYITTFVMMIMLAISVPMLSGTAHAQYGYGSPTVYDRHRKAVNVGGGAAVGALLGALLGGRKGALIGAGVGAVGGIVVTKKQAPRNYYRYRY